VEILIGDPSKARTRLGWSSRIAFHELVTQMVESDCTSAGINLRGRLVSASSGA
jgi:GDPmannose 4,6-dehydratase